ncbi:hypothetical protein STENM223S_00417 [Streptomyces tendae]
MRTRVVLVVRHPGQLDPHRLVRGLRQTRAVEASSLVSGAVAAPEIGRAELLLCERDRPGGLPRGIHPPHGRGETLLQLPDALHIVLRLLVGRHTPVLDDRVRPRVVRGEHVFGQIPAHVLHIGRERAVVRRRRRDRVLRVPHVTVPVPVPVDAVRGPGAGDELRDALRRRMALRLGVEPALLVELGGEQGRIDGRAVVAPLLHECLIRGRHAPLGERLARTAAHPVGEVPRDDVDPDGEQHHEGERGADGDPCRDPCLTHRQPPLAVRQSTADRQCRGGTPSSG